MTKICIYGAGHLTKSLLKGLEFTNFSEQIFLYNRTIERAYKLKEEFQRINVVKNENDLIQDNSFIFIIIPSTEILGLPVHFTDKIRRTNSILISCANYVTLSKLSIRYPDLKIIRILPNVLWQVGCGTTLYLSNYKVKKNEKELFLKILAKIGEIVEVQNENDFDRFGKITTSAPGVLSKLTDLFINELTECSEIEREIIIKTFLSTLSYAIKSKKDFGEIINEVANKGGLTECAVNELNNQLTGKFVKVFSAMDKKIIEKRQQIEKSKSY